MVKRQSQSSAILSNFNPQNSNAVGGLSNSAAAANSIDLQQDAVLGAFLLSSTLSAAALAALTDIYSSSGTNESVAASPLSASSADAISGQSGFQAAAIADTSNVPTGDVSTGAPLALNQHASDEGGQIVTDTGVNVGVLADSSSNLDGAAQAVADGALPPTSDIQTLNELSSSGTDEVQIVHDVAHGASTVFSTADSGGQNFANGIVVANAANAQDAASSALGTSPASITGFSVSTEPTITIAAVTSVDMPGNQAPGTAVAVSPDYSWVGFAVQGSQSGSLSGSQSGTGSSVVAETSGGITIDLNFDTAAMGAPQSFRTGIEQAASLIAAAVSDKITVNINIDYSGTGGGAAAGPDNGLYENYTTVRADLISNATPGDTIFNALPNTTSIQGQSTVAVWNAQLKLFGLLSPNSTTTDDGSATFATDIQSNLLVGVAVHELTHAMGRVPFGSAPDIFDLFRFTSAGNYLFSGNIPAPQAYFSVNGGTTNLAYYGLDSDPSDFLNVSPNLNDPFDEYYTDSTTQALTPLDLEQLDAIGFDLTSSTPSPVSVAYFIANESSLNSIAGGFAISDTAANVQANLAALAADASHITSITATGGTVTVGTAVFAADAAALNEIVGGFAISDTAANVQANLAALAADASHITSITATGGTVTVGTAVFVADAAALNEIVGGFVISDTAASVQANLAALTADASKITSITATGGTVTVGTAVFVADAAALNEMVGGFAISDTAANVQANLAALTADASKITSITATGGSVTVGTGVLSADAAALNKIVGGFAISDTAANVQANLAALAADASHITSITATGGTVTVGTAVFAADAAALNEIVGGFAISDTAANVENNLGALAADANHIASITATGGPVTVGTGVFVADAAALNKIVGGVAISDTAANVQTNLAALAADASHISSITATGGPVTVGTGVFVADEAALNEIVGGFAISDTAANIQANQAALTADASHISSITATGGPVTVGTGLFVADESALNNIAGGFAISDTAANVENNLGALTADAGHITSITATGGQVIVGNGLFVSDQAALNEIVGGFTIVGQASVLQGNLSGLEADISHINSITGLNGTITATVAQFLSDETALNEVVGGFAISDTAANVENNLGALAADANHIALIQATGGQVVVGNGLFVADAAALNEIVGGFTIVGQASVLSGNLSGLEADISHINSITGLNGTITATAAQFLTDLPALNKVIGGYDVDVPSGYDLDVTINGATNISDAVIIPSGPVGLIFDGTTTQNITMTTQEYNDFTTITDGAGTTAANSTITFTNSGTVTTNNQVGNYILAATGGDAITIGTADTVALGSHSSADTITFGTATSTASVTGWDYTKDILKVSAIGIGVVAATPADPTFSSGGSLAGTNTLSMGHVNFVTDSTHAGTEVAFYTTLTNYSAASGHLDTGGATANTILVVNDGTDAVDDVFYVVGNGAHGATSVTLVGAYDVATAHFAATVLA